MVETLPFANFVAIVAPLPKPGAVVEGWMARIRSVDEIFFDRPRIYLNFDATIAPDAPAPQARFGEAMEFRVHPLSDLHRNVVEAVIAASQFTYVHTVHLARFVLGYFPTGKILVDFHGAAPEEEDMLGNPANATFYQGVERTVIANARCAVVVTEAMVAHLRAKYPDCACEFILLPIMEAHDFDSTSRTPPASGAYSVIYAGGTQRWQNLPLMLDAAARTHVDCRYTFLSHDKKVIEREAARVCPGAQIEIAVAGREALPDYYARSDFGFVLRDDNIVNRVACPTKLIEYMRFGVIPIVHSPDIGDFRAFGFEYVTLEEFIDGLIPSRVQLARMAETNLAILRRIRDAFGQGAERLRRLSLDNLVSGGGMRGLPAGVEPQIYPARRELYLFDTLNSYIADWITEPYETHVFECGNAIGQLMRVVPCVLDFSTRGMELDIHGSADGLIHVEVAQSRAKRVGQRDFFSAEAPFIELKFSSPVSVASVGLKLQAPRFGPLIWRRAVFASAEEATGAGSIKVSMVINGQRSEKDIALKYV